MKNAFCCRGKKCLVGFASILLSIFFSTAAFGGGLSLSWSTFLGGNKFDVGIAIAVDDSGCAYVTGGTLTSDFPTTSGAFDETYNGNEKVDAFVVKLDASASGLIYSTFLGGAYDDYGLGIAVDSSGSAYVTGTTRSEYFPTTSGAFDESYGWSGDGFVARLNPSGSDLVYSTFLGGSGADRANAIVLDSTDSAYVTGETNSANFPTTSGALAETLSGSKDTFVTKLNASGTDLIYSSFLGGGNDCGNGISIDSCGSVYVTGKTLSGDFPTTTGAYDDSYGLNGDAFVSKLNSDGSALIYSTFLGESEEDSGEAVAVDSSGCAYVTGTTASSGFPVTSGAYAETHQGGKDAFVTKINFAGTDLVYSTFLGGGADDKGVGIAVDCPGLACITGETYSGDFPTTSGAYDGSYNSGGDAFVTELNLTSAGLRCSTFLGGAGNDRGRSIVLDSSGCVYVAGNTPSPGFPTTSGVYDETHNGSEDMFAVKFNPVSNLSGTVTFEYPGWTQATAPVMYQVREPGLPPTEPLYENTMTVSLTTGYPASGTFTISDIADGTYDVALKHGNHVADMVESVVVDGSDVTGLEFTLWAGDADGDDNVFTVEAANPTDPQGDNDVDLADYDSLYYQYNGDLPLTTGYNGDFDADGNIDLADYYGLYYGYQNKPGSGNWY